MKNRSENTPKPQPELQPCLPPMSLKLQLKQRILDRYDLQEIFNVSRNTIYNWCKAGIINYTQIGRKRYFDAEEIDALLKKRVQVMVPKGTQR
jgi:excisionase family DNA binding protein